MARTNDLIDNPQEFAERLKQIRIRKGLTQTEAAKLLKASYSCYNSWENGLRLPRMNRLKDIAELLEIPLAVLMDKNKKVNFASPELEAMPFVTGSHFYGENSPAKVFLKGTTWKNPLEGLQKGDVFAFYVHDDSMKRNVGLSIPNESIAICKKKFKAQEAANSIALLSFKRGNAMIREIHFDEGNVIATAWNEAYQTQIRPQLEMQIWGLVIATVTDLTQAVI